jgi:hypothetical protein
LFEIQFNTAKASMGLYVEPQPALQLLAPVILVQCNEFLVGRWEADCFMQPSNQRELASAAERAVRNAFPEELFASNPIRVFSCPPEIASKSNWDW